MFTFDASLFAKANIDLAINRELNNSDIEEILELIGLYLESRGNTEFISFTDAYNIGIVLATLFNPSIPLNSPVNVISKFILILSNRVSEIAHPDKEILSNFLKIIKSNIVPSELVLNLKLNNPSIAVYILNQLNRNSVNLTIVKTIFQEIYQRPAKNHLEVKVFVEKLLASLLFAQNSLIKTEFGDPEILAWRIKCLVGFYNAFFKAVS